MRFDWILDLQVVQGFTALLGIAFLVYGARVFFWGAVKFDRVQRQGGSLLLGESLMTAGYWCFQPLARLAIALRVSPNGISWLSLVFGAAAGFALSQGFFGIGAVLSAFSFLMDCLDGMVARRLGVASGAGEVLDAALDRYVEFFFFAGLMIYFQYDLRLFGFCLAAWMGSFMVSYSTAKAEALQIKPPKSMMRRPERAVYLTLGALITPWVEWEWSPMVWSVVFVAILSNISAIWRLVAIARAVRQQSTCQSL